MRGLILLIRRRPHTAVLYRTGLTTLINPKKEYSSQEPLRFNSSSSSSSFSSSSPAEKRPLTKNILLGRSSARGGISNNKNNNSNSKKLPDGPCRTRFAPSPTGYLHLGSLRTALYNYLLAKATGGQFILRIEDTDQTRLVPDAEKRLYDDLRWSGLTWDEGPDSGGPYGLYRQSERLALYDEHADRLIREGKAYRCFCSPEDLEHQKREAHARGEPTHYPGTCRSISPEESEARAAAGSFAVRFKSGERPMVIHDLVYGRYKKAEREEDFIIRKRDGFPTYHFANVVDDRLMQITHVIRGAEWLISTPKHVEMYAAFGWEPPAFAHVGLLVDANRRKLSKRDSGVDMSWYKERKVLPDTLLNFAVLLGWGRPSSVKSDVMTLQQMVDHFAPKFSKGDIVVDLGKLHHLQTKHLREMVKRDDVWDPDTLSRLQIITGPILDAIRRIEETRKNQEQQQETTPRSSSSIIDKTAKRVGEPLPITTQLFSSPCNKESPRSDQNLPEYQQQQQQQSPLLASTLYVRDVLQANNNSLPNTLDSSSASSALENFAAENWFLFFTVPERSLHDETSCKTALLRDHIRDDPANARRAISHLEKLSSSLAGIDEFPPPSPHNNNDNHVSHDRDCAGDVDGDGKKKKASVIEQAIQSCVPSREPSTSGGGGDAKFFWALVRWALTTVDVGPAVVKIVHLIGKEETLSRLEQARRAMVGVLEEMEK